MKGFLTIFSSVNRNPKDNVFIGNENKCPWGRDVVPCATMRASLAELAGLPLLIHTPVWEPRSILCPVQRAPTVFRRTWVGHELRALLLQACPRSSSVCRTKAPAESSEAQLSLGLRNLHLHLSQVRGGCGHEHRARSLAQSAPYRGCSGRLRCVSTVRL